jgi:RHS repeat-associated protein
MRRTARATPYVDRSAGRAYPRALPRRIAATAIVLIACALAAPSAVLANTAVTSNITTNTTWTATGSPYDLDKVGLRVEPGVTLTIEPGVTVDFNAGETATFFIKGTVKALGTVGNPVVFTSHQALSGEGAPGQYLGINVSSGNASSQFSYSDFYYGAKGSAYESYPVLGVVNGSTVSVAHSVFEDNLDAAIRVNKATAHISYSTFANDGDGVSAITQAAVSIEHSTIEKNTQDGLFWNNPTKPTTATSMSVTYNTITANGRYGVYIEQLCESALSLFPHGEYNNIYGNGAPTEVKDQLHTLKPCEALPVDWRNNYWGPEVYFYPNHEKCKAPYFGLLAYTWSKKEHSYEVPEGPLSSWWVYEGTPVESQCGWDTFAIGPGEFLTSPVNGAPEPGGAVLYGGGGSGATSNLNRISCGDPVNCATGNLYESYADLSVPGLNGGLSFSRTYNSQAAASGTLGPMGYGWSISFGESLSLDPSGQAATITSADGSAVTFTQNGEGAFTAPAWVLAKLVHNGEGTWSYTLPDQRVFLFSSTGQLKTITDRNGNVTTLSYSEGGHLETVTDPSGRKLRFAFNGEGLVESIKDPMGHTVKYEYEASNLKSVTLPGESSPRWQYKYDPSHELTTITDGRSGKTTNEYDSAYRVVAQTDPLERKMTWSYAAGETKVTDATGAVTLAKFEGNLPSEVTRGYGTASATTTKYGYDAADNVSSVTDPNGHTTKYEYDAEGNRIKAVDALSDESKWTYDTKHDVLTATTPRGETTTIKRDSHGNPEVIERPAPGAKTQLTKNKYSSTGLLESITDPLERVWKYEYDSYGDRASEIDPEGDKRTFAYDEDSHETSTVSPRGHLEGAEEAKFTTAIERDAQERPLKVTDPLGHATKYAYDANGSLEKLTDANGHATKYEYDADNEQIKVTQPNGATSETGYDEAGRVINQTDGNKHSTKYVRNVLGEVTEVEDPLKRKTTKEYDAASNLTGLTDPAKRTATYTYDHANQLTEVSYSDGKTPTVKYEYDKDGELAKMVDGTGTSSYTYDQLDRLSEAEDGHKDIVKYEYDLAAQLTGITYPGGKAITRAFDNAGRLKSVSDWLEHTTKFAYDADSEQTATTWPSATSEEDTYAFNEADQLTGQAFKKGAETLASLEYSRDNDGQLKTTKQSGLPGEAEVAYSYDENSRLTKAGARSYEYDNADNPTKTGESTNTFDEADELTKGAGVEYSYDELGERTKRTPSSGPATTYAYDQAGDLTGVTRPLEGETPAIEDSYGYDGNGLRASQTISGSTSYLAWDQSGSLPLLLSDGTNSYIYGPGGSPIEQISGEGAVVYLHHDQQGSTRLLTGSTGAVEGAYSFDAYGNQTGHTGTATTPLGYDGQYTNPDTGLIYLRARAYDPSTAQFMSVDPLAAVTGAPYTYAADGPVNFDDLSGLCSSLGSCFDSLRDGVGNLFAGAADTFTGGISTKVLDAWGIEPNTCSVAFGVGQVGILGIPVIGEEGAAAEVVNEGIYVIRGAEGTYVGQSGNIARRLSEHLIENGGRFTREELNAADRFAVPGGKTAREIAEQQKIDEFPNGIDDLLNKRNPIGPRRFHLMPEGYSRP